MSCTSERAPQRTEHISSNTTLSVVVTGLQPFTEYRCCVSANSAVGAGPTNCTTEDTLEAGKAISYHIL